LSVVDRNGKSSIRTSSPSQKLHVAGGIARVENSAACGFDIRNTNASFDTSISVGAAGNPNYCANWNAAANTQTDTSKPTWSVRLRVDTDQIQILRVAPGPGAVSNKLLITAAGELLPGTDNTGSVGKEGQKWSLVRATTISPGDLAFENNFRVTEDERVGLAFKNDAGEKIAVLDRKGNFYVKGKVIEDLPT